MGDSRRRDQSTAALAINKTISPACPFGSVQLKVHLNAVGGAGNLTVTVDANAGAAYDVVLLTQDMTLVTDLLWVPPDRLEFQEGDKLVVAWANAGGKTYGLEVSWKQVH